MQSLLAVMVAAVLMPASAVAAVPAPGKPSTARPAASESASSSVASKGAKSAAAAVGETASSSSSSASAAALSALLTSDQVSAHLDQTVDWYRHLAPVEQLQVAASDPGSRDKLHHQALTAVGLAFDFARAAASLIDAQTHATPTAGDSTAAPDKGYASRLEQAANTVDQRIAALQSQLDALKRQIAHARANQRKTLEAQQGEATAALELAHEMQSTMQDMRDFEANNVVGDNGNLSPLDQKIADLERSVPELRPPSGTHSHASHSSSSSASSSSSSGGSAAPAAAGAAAAAAAAAFRADSAGVIALVTEWLSLNDMRRQLNNFIKETGQLRAGIEKLRTGLVADVRNVMGDDLTLSTSNDLSQLLARRQTLESDATRFKQLATLLVPLGEQGLTLESGDETLDNWQSTIATRMRNVGRYLAIRLGIVLSWVAVVLIVSDIWRRATFRYLHDLRRRRQFLVLRRVAVSIALVVVIVFGLVSEIGSVATYIGVVTAGVAVAMQNVILAVVAYFFLIGRYGVRVGDRITLSGVTGRVVDIGLVRIYLMELAGADLHATGRMVVLSNAVLFQPTALFKQIPGADYVWHTVTLTIVATADVMEAHKRLKAAAEKVYAGYRSDIERQHELVQRFIDFDASSPQPEVRVRLTENGLECSVRYPVTLENAAVIDQQMLKALRDALERDEQFKLVSSGAVVLKSSD